MENRKKQIVAIALLLGLAPYASAAQAPKTPQEEQAQVAQALALSQQETEQALLARVLAESKQEADRKSREDADRRSREEKRRLEQEQAQLAQAKKISLADSLQLALQTSQETYHQEARRAAQQKQQAASQAQQPGLGAYVAHAAASAAGLAQTGLGSLWDFLSTPATGIAAATPTKPAVKKNVHKSKTQATTEVIPWELAVIPVAQQSDATCGDRALYNGFHDLRYRQSRMTLQERNNRLLNSAAEIEAIKKRFGQNLEVREMHQLAAHLGLNSNEYTIIGNIREFNPDIVNAEQLTTTITNLRTTPGAAHMFTLGNMRHYVDPKGKSTSTYGHWISIVVSNNHGIISYNAMDSAKNIGGTTGTIEVLAPLLRNIIQNPEKLSELSLTAAINYLKISLNPTSPAKETNAALARAINFAKGLGRVSNEHLIQEFITLVMTHDTTGNFTEQALEIAQQLR